MLAAVPRTPETAFVYWSAPEPPRGAPRRTLRVRTSSDHGRTTRLVELRPLARSLYLTDLPPGGELEVALGRSETEGFRVSLGPVRLRMPPRNLAPPGRSQWRDHRTGQPIEGYAAAVGSLAASAQDLGRNLPPHPSTAPRVHVASTAPNPRAVPARR